MSEELFYSLALPPVSREASSGASTGFFDVSGGWKPCPIR